jgi:hypothetical protein
MMEAARTSETLVNFYQTIRRYSPEDSHLHAHILLQNLSSCTYTVAKPIFAWNETAYSLQINISLNTAVFWDVAPCSVVDIDRRFILVAVRTSVSPHFSLYFVKYSPIAQVVTRSRLTAETRVQLAPCPVGLWALSREKSGRSVKLAFLHLMLTIRTRGALLPLSSIRLHVMVLRHRDRLTFNSNMHRLTAKCLLWCFLNRTIT